MKSLLLSGRIIELRSGEFAMILLNAPQGDIFTNAGNTSLKETWGPLHVFDHNLQYNDGTDRLPNGDIMRIYDVPRGEGNRLAARFSLIGRNIIWDRDALTKKDLPFQ